MNLSGSISPVVSAVILGVALLAALSIVYRSWRNGISPMPSPVVVRRAAVRELRKLLRTPVSNEADGCSKELDAPPGYGTIVEAGAGWGSLAVDLARSFPQRQIIGIENSILPWLFSRLAVRLSAVRNIRLLRGDIYEYSYEEAAAVFCYLYPGAMKRLDPILRSRLAAGAWVVSICFALPGWRAAHEITCSDLYRTKIYFYRIEPDERGGI
ncbi:class I SAM-dependent methyltransferase [Paenibacillus senegalimassiliensis]|uniref:class I SAM-dependent methyltransferase n=1 Tax=Paenibacillus senegalimassiliensis TaxID=1737426 RepID=UPI00073E82A8|nr:class I SAM-dependent methyltransferase [Paenibacillus senegalimassiliensis]